MTPSTRLSKVIAELRTLRSRTLVLEQELLKLSESFEQKPKKEKPNRYKQSNYLHNKLTA